MIRYNHLFHTGTVLVVTYEIRKHFIDTMMIIQYNPEFRTYADSFLMIDTVTCLVMETNFGKIKQNWFEYRFGLRCNRIFFFS